MTRRTEINDSVETSRDRARPRDEAAQSAAVKEEEAEAEEVKIRAVEWWPVVKAEQVEEVEIRAVEWVGEGGKRRRVKREEGGTAEAGPSGRGAGRAADRRPRPPELDDSTGKSSRVPATGPAETAASWLLTSCQQPVRAAMQAMSH